MRLNSQSRASVGVLSCVFPQAHFCHRGKKLCPLATNDNLFLVLFMKENGNSDSSPAIRGRGSVSNPAGRFERLSVEYDVEASIDDEGEIIQPRTHFLRDDSQTVLS